MRVAVDHGGDGEADQRLLEAAVAEEGEDLARLALDGADDRCVVDHGDAPGRAQAGERSLELERLVEGLAHEGLDRGLAPGAEGVAAEAAAEALDAGEADPEQLDRLTVEQLHAGVEQHVAELGRVPRLEVVVAEHRDDRGLDVGELADQHLGLLDRAVVGQVAGQHQDVGRQRRLLGDRRQQALRAAGDVQVAERGDADGAGRVGHEASGQRGASMAAVQWAMSSGAMWPWTSRASSYCQRTMSVRYC